MYTITSIIQTFYHFIAHTIQLHIYTAQLPLLFLSPCWLPFVSPLYLLGTLVAVTGIVHLGLRLLVNWPHLPHPSPNPPLPSKFPEPQLPSASLRRPREYSGSCYPEHLPHNPHSFKYYHTVLTSPASHSPHVTTTIQSSLLSLHDVLPFHYHTVFTPSLPPSSHFFITRPSFLPYHRVSLFLYHPVLTPSIPNSPHSCITTQSSLLAWHSVTPSLSPSPHSLLTTQSKLLHYNPVSLLAYHTVYIPFSIIRSSLPPPLFPSLHSSHSFIVTQSSLNYYHSVLTPSLLPSPHFFLTTQFSVILYHVVLTPFLPHSFHYFSINQFSLLLIMQSSLLHHHRVTLCLPHSSHSFSIVHFSASLLPYHTVLTPSLSAISHYFLLTQFSLLHYTQSLFAYHAFFHSFPIN